MAPKAKSLTKKPSPPPTALSPADQKIRDKKIKDVLKFWTSQKMKDAESFSLPKVHETADDQKKRQVSLAKLVAKAADNSPKLSLAKTPQFMHTGIAHAVSTLTQFTAPVPDRSILPFSSVGKLFSSFNGGQMQGTAWIIGSRAICTAAHCTFDKGGQDDNGQFVQPMGMAQNLMFCPQFDNGDFNGMRFVILPDEIILDDGWVNSPDFSPGSQPDFNFDFSMGITHEAMDAVSEPFPLFALDFTEPGALGIGYPARGAFNGQIMIESGSNFVHKDNSSVSDFSVNGMFFVATGMTPGCSGGPIVIEDGGTFKAVGLNSHTRQSSQIMFSPFMGKAFIKMVNTMVQNGGNP